MNSAVAAVLNRVLGDWLEGLDSDSLNLSLLSGSVRLGPIRIRTDAVDKLGFPFMLRYGFVKSIVVTIPWTSLTSKPLKVDLEGVYIYVSPRPRDEWNPDTELRNQQFIKRTKLANYEALSREQLPDDPGFVTRLVTKIIANLQLSISGVFIRYEDHISSVCPYASSIVLKHMQAVTCNQNWAPEFTEDAKVLYKLVRLEGAAMYMDYGVNGEADLPNPDRKPEGTAFEDLAALETNPSSTLDHRYLLYPAVVEMNLVLNQDPGNHTIPQASLTLNVGAKGKPIKVGLETPMATHAIKCASFFSEFHIFQTGVYGTNIEGKFTQEEAQQYRSLYLKWRGLTDDKKAKALLPQLESFERSHSFEDITAERRIAIQDSQFAEKEAVLEAKRKALSEPEKEGRMSRITGYVWGGPSEEEKKQKEAERRRQLELAEAELSAARESRSKFHQELASFVQDQDETDKTDKAWDRFKVRVRLNGYELVLAGASQKYMYVSMDRFRLDAVLRSSSMEVSLSLYKFSVLDEFVKSAVFPALLETEGLTLRYKKPDEGPAQLNLETKQLLGVANVECLMGLFGELVKATSGLVDVSALTASATSRSQPYIEAGKKYMKQTISGKYTRTPLQLNFHVVAPCFIIPLSLTSTERFLAIDFGELTATSVLAQAADPALDYSTVSDPALLYDCYQFALRGVEISTVWRSDSLSQWKAGSKSPLFAPEGLAMEIKVNTQPLHPILPGIVVKVVNGIVPIEISEEQIFLLLQIKDNFMERLTAAMRKAKPAELEPESPMTPATPVTPVSAYVPIEPSSPSPALSIVSSFLHVTTDLFCIRISLAKQQIFEYRVVKSLLALSLTSQGNIIFDFKVKDVFATDTREGVVWRQLLGDPNMLGQGEVQEVEENAFLQFISQPGLREFHGRASGETTTNNCDFSVRLAVLEQGQDIRALMRVGDMSMSANPDSMKALLEVPAAAFRMLEESKSSKLMRTQTGKVTEKKVRSYLHLDSANLIEAKTLTTRRKIDVKIVIDCMEIRLPVDPRDLSCKVFCFYIENDFYFRSEESYRYSLSANNHVISCTPVTCDKEARVDIYNLGMTIGYEHVDLETRENRILTANGEKGELMKPCRLSLNLAQNWIGNEMRHNVEINLETFELVVGFRDIAFFKTLAEVWMGLYTPPKSSPTTVKRPIEAASVSAYRSVFLVDLTSECLQFDLCDDTRSIIVPLVRSQAGNLSAQVAYAPDNFTLSCTGSVETSYYNSFVASWEPLLQYWTFELQASPKPPKKPKDSEVEQPSTTFLGAKPLAVEFKSVMPLHINVTYSMVRTLSVVMNTLKHVMDDVRLWLDEKRDFGDAISREQSRVIYKLKNRTGDRLTVSIEGPGADHNKEEFHFELASDSSRLVAQRVFESAAGRTLSTKKYASLLQTPQVPSFISIAFHGAGRIVNVPVDHLGLYAYKSSPGVLSIIEVTAKSSRITISIESALKVLNNSDRPLSLSTSKESIARQTMSIPAGRSQALPLLWTDSPNLISVQTANGQRPLFSGEPSMQLAENCFVVVDVVELKAVAGEDTQRLILLNPPITIQSFLPCALEVKASSSPATIHRIESGQKLCIYSVNPSEKPQYEWTLDLGADRGRVSTRSTELKQEDEHFALFGDVPCDKLSFKYSATAKYNHCEDCDIEFRPTVSELYRGELAQVYIQYWIVNHTDFVLDFTGKKDLLQIQKHGLGMVKCKQNSLTVRLAKDVFGVPSEFSQKFNITTTGVAGLIKLRTPEEVKKPTDPAEISLGVLIQTGSWPILKSTIIHIYPRYILTNYFDVPIYVRQHLKSVVVEVAPKGTLEYQLEDGRDGKCVQISMDKDSWSSPFSLDEIEDFQVRFAVPASFWREDGLWWQPTPANQHRQYVRVVVSTDTEATLFIALVPPVEAEIYIKNKSGEAITVCQCGCDIETVVPSDSKLPFAYDNRLESTKKVVFRTSSAEQTYVLDKIKNFQKPLGDLSVVSMPEISSRVVIIRKKSKAVEAEEEKQLTADTWLFANVDFMLYLPGLELSLHDEVPAERFLLTVAVIQLKAKQRIGRTESKLERYTQHSFTVSVQHVQLDNMSMNPAEFPIIFGGTDAAAAVSLLIPPARSSEVTPFFQFGVIREHIEHFSQSGSVKAAFDRFMYLNMTVQEMQVRVHQDTVTGLLEVAKRLQAGFFNTEDLRKAQSVHAASLESVCPALSAATPKPSRDPEATAWKVYLRMLQMNALKVVLSFKTGHKRVVVLDPKQAFGLLGLLSTVGGAFTNISDSTLHFSSVIVCDSFQTINSIVFLVVKNYVKQGVLQFYKILGSSDLIGNPIGLIDKLGTGVFEFFSEPVKGLMQASPKKFAKGLGKGVKSLVGGVVSGSFGSVSKITGSLYTVVRQIGGDEESANRINATDNVAEGLYHGVKGGIVDLTEGVTGIFTKPWQGARRGGVTGFLKGVSSGLMGAVTAPLSAVLRVSTSVTSSVVAQAELLEDKVKQQGRMRFARQFGGKKVLEPYSHELAQAQHLLQSMREFAGEEFVFYMRTGVHERVVLTQTRLFYLSKDSIEFECRIDRVKSSVTRHKGDFRLVLVGDGQLTFIGCEVFQRLAKLHYAIQGLHALSAKATLIS